jgi:hypothetical protein
MLKSIYDLEVIGRNLYAYQGKFYRLFGKGITPNGCWIIGPYMQELKDIKIVTGKDVYGDGRLDFDGVTGTVQRGPDFITY